MANPSEEIHKGDTGTVITITVQDQSVAVDVSGATVKDAILESPSEVQKTVALTFTTDGVNGKLDLTTLVGTFDESGNWKIQVKITDPSGTWRTNVFPVKVYSNLSDA